MRVLHVEDNATDVDLTRRFIARQEPDITIDAVNTMAEGWRKLVGEGAYDLMLLDIRLPDGNGLELLTKVRANGLPLPVVVFTGSGDQEAAVAALKAGADDYVIKGEFERLAPLLIEARRRYGEVTARRSQPLRVLYARHEAGDVDLTRRFLRNHAPHIQLEVASGTQEVLRRLVPHAGVTTDVDVLLLDYLQPDKDALTLTKQLRQVYGLELPIILVADHGREEVAVQALRLGADDFITKHEGYLHELVPALENAHNQRQLARYREHLEELVRQRTAELEAAQVVAEAANRAKSAFLANMSHEIRTPLNAILGMAYLIRKEGLPPSQGDKLNKLEAAGVHLLGIINAVLDLSKIEGGKLELEEKTIDIDEILDDIANMLLDQAQAKGIVLRTKSQELPRGLLGDGPRLRQALLNLVGNAVKFTERGAVTVRVSSLEVADESVLLRFEVEDTGVGVVPEVLPRLFNDFEQAASSTTRNFGGTGLGLAITRRFARLMGGDAGAESTPGVGSRFWFTARLRRDASDVANFPRAPVEDGGGKKAEVRLRRDFGGTLLLLVEDDAINREIAVEMLHGVDLRVDQAEDGAEAVRLAEGTPYAAILMDMEMPVMGGLEATRRIRRVPRHGSTPILAMTANAFADDRDRCMVAGMDDFIVKPVDPQTLFGTLWKWLARGDPPSD